MNTTVKFNNNLNKIADRIGKIPKTQNVPLTNLMDNSFISSYTNFSTLTELQEAFEKEYKTEFEVKMLEGSEWNTFISTNTRFSNWETMYKKAGQLYLAKQVSKAIKG